MTAAVCDVLEDTDTPLPHRVTHLVVRRSTGAPAWDRRPETGRHDVVASES